MIAYGQDPAALEHAPRRFEPGQGDDGRGEHGRATRQPGPSAVAG